MLSQEAIEQILGIEEKVDTTVEQMAGKLNITFFPHEKNKVSKNILSFADDLKKSLEELGVNIVPYEDSLFVMPIWRICRRFFRILTNNTKYVVQTILGGTQDNIYINFEVIENYLKRKRIKRGISVVALGQGETNNLPMDYTSSFTKNSVITIVDVPKNIDDKSDFFEHFNTSLSLFALHMTNIVIAVDDNKWILYNFNASHPIYDRKIDLNYHVLHALVPKIAAPIAPHKFEDFNLLKKQFDINDNDHKFVVQDLVEGSTAFDETKLYPPRKLISDLPFRNNFYRWIGQIHLDHRSGMSYGFLARQMPTKLSKLISAEEARKQFGPLIPTDKDYFYISSKLFVKIILENNEHYLKIPDVWVLTQRSGSDKTHFDPKRDLIKLGLVDGDMYLQTPIGLKLNKDYKPSFDTKVILAHSVGNAIIASVLRHFNPESQYAKSIEQNGVAIAHWHGYFNPIYVPKGWILYGLQNPHVSCSSPQSAIYALSGKLESYFKTFGKEFCGDIHVEPHHGTNICYPSLKLLSKYFIENKEATALGNKYLNVK